MSFYGLDEIFGILARIKNMVSAQPVGAKIKHTVGKTKQNIGKMGY